jgi:HKD family nuclease
MKKRIRLLKDGPAIVIGAPRGFDLLDTVARAAEIRFAAAYSHMSGWRLLRKAFRSKRSSTALLTGQDFYHTEPKVLDAWLRLQRGGLAQARLWTSGVSFHPKVLIATSRLRNGSCALVGSGNLSAGGLCDNVECFLYTSNPSRLRKLTSWFDDMFSDDGRATPLSREVIAEYRNLYRPAQQARQRLRRLEERTRRRIRRYQAGHLAARSDALAEARRYFHSSGYAQDRKEWIAGAGKIRRALRYPKFDFDRDGWHEFYSVWEMGHLIPVHRERAYRNRLRLQEGLRRLVDERLPIEERIGSLLEPGGRYRTTGLGLNGVSKILAVHARKKWPVYNAPVVKALRHFGYESGHGGSGGLRYRAFADRMGKFARQSNAPDMIALDAFFYRVWDRQLMRA